MMLYDAACTVCNRKYEYSVAHSLNRDDTPMCCGTRTVRVFIKPQLGVVDNPAFMSQYKQLYAGNR